MIIKLVSDIFTKKNKSEMPHIFSLIKRIYFKGYSPHYYFYKLRKIIKDFFFKKPVPILKNDLTFFNENGFMKLNSDNNNKDKIIKICNSIAKKHKIEKIKKGKTFTNLIAKNEGLMHVKEINEYVNSKYFREIPEKYLGCKPILSDVYLMLSFPTPEKQNHSQLWHLDGDDTRICTFYLYCSDVNEQSGPFRLLPKKDTNKQLLPKYFRRYGYSNIDFFNNFGGKKNIVTFLGKKTEFVCDTANIYHCGSYCESEPRLVLAFRYLTQSPLYKLSDWAKEYNSKFL